MNTTKCSTIARNALCLAGDANQQLEKTESKKTMKKAILVSLVLAVAGIAGAANVPSGLTGLWRFQDNNNFGAATIGNDITFNTSYGALLTGPYTEIGIDSWHTKFTDGAIFQEQQYNYMSVAHGISANGGGSYVNQYTVAIDYFQGSEVGFWNGNYYNSLFQTATGNGNDGDLFIRGPSRTNSVIGCGDTGYSTLTFDSSTWHRIVWSVDNSSFFRVYVDGVLFLDAPGQGVDGRFSLDPSFLLFADNDGEDAWGLVGTAMIWDHALTTAEVAGMGGWTNGAATPTPLHFSDAPPTLMSVSPADGETNVAPGFAYRAIILDLDGLVDTSSIQLLLDGAPMTPVITTTLAQKCITLSGGLLQSGTTHKYTLVAAASGVYSTNEVTFTVQHNTSYEWRFTSGDLSAALGNGVMSYADPDNTPGITSFGTTDGSTVPFINGSPAKYMHVPAFTLNTDGYLLQFNDSGPNVGAEPKINRYTLIFDILVPGPIPWPDWVVPFFNTDPYNLDDADFYLTGKGEIGIGFGGYSATNIIAANNWYRIAFVADLKANTLTYYVNGTNVKSRAADGLGGRWSLYSNQDAGPDLLLFNEPTGTSTHELYLSSVAFADRVLSADEIAGLGGPSANGILVPSFTPKPTLAIRAGTSGATVSWPTNYVGYALEQADSLTAPQWKPVAGITNNAMSVIAGSTARFYRLAQ
jgi:hypothetical protein